MKTFSQFLQEAYLSEGIPAGMSRDEFNRLPAETRRRLTGSQSGIGRQGETLRLDQTPLAVRGARMSGNVSPEAWTRRNPGKLPIPNPPSTPPSSTPPRTSPNRIQRLGTGALRLGGITAADMAADTAISNIKDPTTRSNVQTVKDFATFASTPVISTLNIAGSSAPSGKRDVGPYSVTRRVDTSAPGSGFKEFLATGKGNSKYTYNDPSEKIMAYRRDRVGSGRPEDRPFRVGAARLGGQIVPVQWGTVAGEKRVGTPAQAASTQATQQSREIASKAKIYGATKGSAITGTGGPTSINQQKGTITSGGRTAKLSSTQLVRDPKTGKQVVGDLAYRGGKPVYLARPSIASRDTNLFSRLSRATGIGGQRERDVAAAKREYRTALKNTQRFQSGMGLTPQKAKALGLPGR